MTTHAEPASRQSGLILLILFLVTMLVLLVLWITVGLNWNGSDDASALATIPAIAGGTIIPAATEINLPAIETLVMDSAELPTLDDSSIVPGQSAIITNQATAGSANQIPIYGEPTGDDILTVYPAGTLLTIIEPSGDYGDYPVVIDGQRWVRTQSSIGLVGWVQAAVLQAAVEIDANEPAQLLIDQVKNEPSSEQEPGQEPGQEPIQEPAQPAQQPAVENTVAPALEAQPTPTSTPAG